MLYIFRCTPIQHHCRRIICYMKRETTSDDSNTHFQTNHASSLCAVESTSYSLQWPQLFHFHLWNLLLSSCSFSNQVFESCTSPGRQLSYVYLYLLKCIMIYLKKQRNLLLFCVARQWVFRRISNAHCHCGEKKKTLQQPLPNAQTNGQNDAFLSILVEFSLIASYFHLISREIQHCGNEPCCKQVPTFWPAKGKKWRHTHFNPQPTLSLRKLTRMGIATWNLRDMRCESKQVLHGCRRL
jgi:hypothetical protein